MTRKIFAANWKMYKTPTEAREFLKPFLGGLKIGGEKSDGKSIVIFPPAVCAEAVATELKVNDKLPVFWGAQNAYFEKEGAFTGETSPSVIKSMGGSFVLIGHSERRAIFNEQGALLANKVAATQSLGLIPMLCVGESLAEREAGKTNDVIREQLRDGLRLAKRQLHTVIAYEPVWAIGTGRVATAIQANEAHEVLKKELTAMGWDAENTPILYGGSVKPENAKELLSQRFVDGFLVGGASLKPESFLAIIGA